MDDFDCDAYGPCGREVSALCLLLGELGKRKCASQAQCAEAMGGERRRVFRRIPEPAAAGDPVGWILRRPSPILTSSWAEVRKETGMAEPVDYPEPDPDHPETWPFPGPPVFSGALPDLPNIPLDPATAAEAGADAFDDDWDDWPEQPGALRPDAPVDPL